ncbi:AraC family transcriptional regulator [Shinella sp. PSBB067]|uniref:AraC family transcriptional regulator n=1 Tax=unclassified Shinella TaxID=2643062 RepID=UPI0009291D44|nr:MULTISPECIES: AraC family transcriptional regulator [unclassified Shinella]MBN9056550.1 AraC family transcriptional regulator [Hyphomicrobiales bacterium]OJU87080.1 MAG: hypothetical protein BGO06_00185 [Shinella sp. 65-6]QRI62966.1 AraC family transcriptional regulator [Shinella sp. PSBB067]
MISNGSYIRACALIGFVELARKLGGDPDSLLLEAGLSPSILKDVDMLVSFRRCAILLELSAQRLGRPSFGLEWAIASQPHFQNLGPLTLLEFVTADFREWLDLGLRSLTYHTNAYVLRQVEPDRPGEVCFRYTCDSFALTSRQQTEHIFALIVMLARKACNRPDERPSLIRFSHKKPADLSLHENIFRCPIEFDAAHDEFVFPDALLQLRTSGNFRLFQPLVNRFIRYRIDQLPVYDQSATVTVELTIPSVIGTGNCNIELVAEALGTNVKRLQRTLASENTSFSEILEKVRQNMALRLLTESDAPIERIAGLLDYSSTPPFTLAFKRWKGMSPLQYRKKVRSGHNAASAALART